MFPFTHSCPSVVQKLLCVLKRHEACLCNRKVSVLQFCISNVCHFKVLTAAAEKKVDHLIIGELMGIINLKNTRNGERSDLDFGTKLH